MPDGDDRAGKGRVVPGCDPAGQCTSSRIVRVITVRRRRTRRRGTGRRASAGRRKRSCGGCNARSTRSTGTGPTCRFCQFAVGAMGTGIWCGLVPGVLPSRGRAGCSIRGDGRCRVCPRGLSVARSPRWRPFWRGAFLARGSVSEPGRAAVLEIGCPSPEAALALVGAARHRYRHASAGERLVAVRSDGIGIAALLQPDGCPRRGADLEGGGPATGGAPAHELRR